MSELPPGYNPAAVGALPSSSPPASTLNGGRIFGLLPPDTGGFLNGLPGWASKELPAFIGGLSSANKPQGMFGKFLESIRGDFAGLFKNDPGAAAVTGANNPMPMGGGGPDLASMTAGVAAPSGMSFDGDVPMASSGRLSAAAAAPAASAGAGLEIA